jgi:hypothetical protein
MIVWPDDRILSSAARDNIARFRATAGAKTLEADTHQWTFQSWARLPEPPYRMILVSDGGEQATITIEENGLWNINRQPLR